MCTFLRSLAKINQNKKWIQKKKKKKMTREEFKIEIGNFKEIKVLHYSC